MPDMVAHGSGPVECGDRRKALAGGQRSQNLVILPNTKVTNTSGMAQSGHKKGLLGAMVPASSGDRLRIDMDAELTGSTVKTKQGRFMTEIVALDSSYLPERRGRPVA